jgi:hypothetical protein
MTKPNPYLILEQFRNVRKALTKPAFKTLAESISDKQLHDKIAIIVAAVDDAGIYLNSRLEDEPKKETK